jgi:RNA polymerase sigma-70 factor, ECF subfamily
MGAFYAERPASDPVDTAGKDAYRDGEITLYLDGPQPAERHSCGHNRDVLMSRALGASPSDLDDGGTPPPLSAVPPTDDPILRLVAKIKSGEDVEGSYAELHRRFYRSLLSSFQNKGFSSEDARDLTQDVFLRVFKSIDTFRQESRFERWLFEIAVNMWKNEIRRLRAEKRDGLEQSLDAEVEGEKTFELAASDPSALDKMIMEERQEVLHAALQELPPQMRYVCELRYIQQRKYQEIADLLRISIETVKAHLHQARKRLIEKLRPVRPKEREAKS